MSEASTTTSETTGHPAEHASAQAGGHASGQAGGHAGLAGQAAGHAGHAGQAAGHAGGHAGHGPEETEPLGPIDPLAWGAGALGVVLGLVIAACFALATSAI